MIGKLPKFIEESNIPKGYYLPVDPYKSPEPSFIDLKAMVAYAKKHGKAVTELSYAEAVQFYIEKDPIAQD